MTPTIVPATAWTPPLRRSACPDVQKVATVTFPPLLKKVAPSLGQRRRVATRTFGTEMGGGFHENLSPTCTGGGSVRVSGRSTRVPGQDTSPDGRVPHCAQPSQRFQVLHVQGIGQDRAGPFGAVRFLGLDEDRQAIEPRIGEDAAERLETEAAEANMLVPIDAAPARLLRIVRMERTEPVEADDAIEGFKCVAVAGFGCDVVAGGHEMARVEAHADARAAVQVFEDGREMFEAVSEGAPLSRRVLEQDHRFEARLGAEREAHPFGDQAEPVVFTPSGAGARMNDDPEEPERVGAIEFVGEGRERLLAQ